MCTFEEGILHSWMGGLVHPLGWGCRGLVQKNARGAEYARLTPTAGDKTFLRGESGTVLSLLTSAASDPWCRSHAGDGMLHTKPGGGGECK